MSGKRDDSEFGGESAGQNPMDTGIKGGKPHHPPGHPLHKKRDDSEFGGESVGQNPMDQGRVPTQEELDADRAANPDTSEQVGGSERDGGGA